MWNLLVCLLACFLTLWGLLVCHQAWFLALWGLLVCHLALEHADQADQMDFSKVNQVDVGKDCVEEEELVSV